MIDPNATLWTQVPHTKWPSKCPKCGSGLSYTSYEPYCAYEDCRWNNDPEGVTASGDAERLDWLMRQISGAELRRLGIVTSGGMTRKLLDRVMAAAGVNAPGEGQR